MGLLRSPLSLVARAASRGAHASVLADRARPLALLLLLAAFALAVLGVGLVGACAKPRPPAPPPVEPADPSRFPHVKHRDQGCQPCHDGDAQPGRNNHAPCDQGQCHRADFLRPPGALCSNCHTSVAVGGAGVAAPLQPFPRITGWRNLPSAFSHAQHLDAARIEAAVGFHLSCSDCHATSETGSPTHPDHAVCARCHSEEVALPNAPAMGSCAGCHREPAARPRVRARMIKNDLHFSHGNHRADRAGTAIPCATCHRDSSAATGYTDHRPPAVASCVPCHDDTARVPSEQRMRQCQTCHRDKSGSLIALAPRNHLPGTERPIDHTLAFRTEHGDAAARDAARCATCHTVMSGSPRDACDECHRATEPADHRLAWRELEHGAEAATSPSRCALCHNADSCKDCHSRPPRSHLPLMAFTDKHADLARINIRSCLTCHDPGVADCSRSGCHAPAAPMAPTGMQGRPW